VGLEKEQQIKASFETFFAVFDQSTVDREYRRMSDDRNFRF